MSFWNKIILPISLLSGTIIGAGVFSLPYVFKTTGLGISIVYAFLFCGVAMSIFFMYADLLRRHPGVRYSGLLRAYFGSSGRYASFALDIVQLFFALSIYVILSESFLKLIISGYDGVFYTVFFWFLGSLFLFIKRKKEALFEFIALVGIVAVVLVLAGLGLEHIPRIQSIAQSFSYAHIFLPFGALLFAFNGRSVIPDVILLARDDARSIHRSIFWGLCISLFVYILFVLGVFGLSLVVSQDAVSGLVGAVHPFVLIGVGILGVLTLLSSYVGIGENVRRTLAGDLNISSVISGLMVVALPILFYLSGLRNFITLVLFVGGLLTATEWMCTAYMWRTSFHKKQQELPKTGLLFPTFIPWIFYGVMVILSIAFVYTLITFLF